MNPEPQPPTEFDPGEELAHFHDPEHQLYGLSERIFFYLAVTCKAIEVFSTPVFSVRPILGLGCVVEFVVHEHEFWIDVSGSITKLWAASADEPDAKRWIVFEGDSANPTVWEGLLQAIGRIEHFGVFINHADRLRLMWSQHLAEQQRRRDERGF